MPNQISNLLRYSFYIFCNNIRSFIQSSLKDMKDGDKIMSCHFHTSPECWFEFLFKLDMLPRNNGISSKYSYAYELVDENRMKMEFYNHQLFTITINDFKKLFPFLGQYFYETRFRNGAFEGNIMYYTKMISLQSLNSSITFNYDICSSLLKIRAPICTYVTCTDNVVNAIDDLQFQCHDLRNTFLETELFDTLLEKIVIVKQINVVDVPVGSSMNLVSTIQLRCLVKDMKILNYENIDYSSSNSTVNNSKDCDLMLYNYVLSQLDVDKKYLLPLDKKGCVIPYENITSARKRYYKHIPDPTFIDDDDVEENIVSNLKCHTLKRRYVDNTSLIDSINAFVNHYNNKSDITSLFTLL